MNTILEKKKKEIFQACRDFHVKELFTFGSVNTDRFGGESDIDLLVDFKLDEIALEDYADNYFEFQFLLESLLGRTVDLVTIRSIRNPYFLKELLKTRQPLFPQN